MRRSALLSTFLLHPFSPHLFLVHLFLLHLWLFPCISAASPLTIVATVGMIGDVASEIGGSEVTVTNLMGEGVDPHLYKPAPGDMRLLSQADVVLFAGLHLEGRMAEMLEKLASRKPVYAVTDGIDKSALRSPPEFQGNYDPHVWFDVSLWSVVAARITEILASHRPASADAIRTRGRSYQARLAELDTWVKRSLSKIPAESRVLVTAHDAFGYFGRAYNLEVLGIQGISTDSEASIKDISRLIETIVSRKVPAVFVESSVPRKTVESLVEGAAARGHQLTIGGELFSDAMGRPGTFEGTYIGMVTHNVNVIAHALSPPAT